MAKIKITQRSVDAISNNVTCDPSLKPKHIAADNNGAPLSTNRLSPPSLRKARRSPYLRKVASLGSKFMFEAEKSVPLAMRTVPFGTDLRTPCMIPLMPDVPAINTACNFVDSVISLCKKSLALVL
jgi:hypothetical protein